MFDLMVIAEVTKAHQHDVLKEAEDDRLVQKVRASRIGLRERVLAGIGGALISAGQKLQERHMPVMSRGPEA